MTYEEKMMLMARVKPSMKDILLTKIIKGEKVDITLDEDLFYQVNKDRVTLEQFVNREKFRSTAEDMKRVKEGLYDDKFGRCKDKKVRWLGDIPAEIYFSRPEFSPNLSKDERLRNIKKFLNAYPVFRAGEKQV